MKLSNKILLGFFGTVILYTLIAAGEIRFKGVLRSENKEGFLVESIAIDSHKHLIIRNSNIDISVNQSETTRMEIRSYNEEKHLKISYQTSGDTLIINSVNPTEESETTIINVYLDNRLQSITSKAIRTYVRNFKSDSLTVIASENYLSFDDDNEIQHLQLTGQEGASVYLLSDQVNSLDLLIDDATVTVIKELAEINAELINGAVLTSKAPDNLQFKKERNCKVMMYQ